MSRPHIHSRLPMIAAARLAVACVVLLAVGCSSSDSTAPPPGSTGPSFNLTFMAPGVSQQLQFTQAGRWAYHCIVHQAAPMVGTVIVDSTSTVDSAVVDVGGTIPLRFTPETVTIKRNGWVRWVNTSGLTTHTVTRP